MIAKDEFLKKYNISEDQFKNADISWEDLCDIYKDFADNKKNKYEAIQDDFLEKYLKNLNHDTDTGEKRVKIHSFHSRVKNPEHLIAKIIRKKQENLKKYQQLDKTNYEKFITDLIGIRCLLLFKDDWKSFHNYIVTQFDNNMNYYIRDSIQDFDDDQDHLYIAEKPKAHIRNGDARDIYDELLPPDCVIDGKIYRSVHYIIKYKGVYLEIQVRTLFEEGWGEVDHAVIYPYYQNDQVLKEYTELLNRLSGLADEMSSFFYRLKKLEVAYLGTTTSYHKDGWKENSRDDQAPDTPEDSYIPQPQNTKPVHTPYDCLQSILDE